MKIKNVVSIAIVMLMLLSFSCKNDRKERFRTIRKSISYIQKGDTVSYKAMYSTDRFIGDNDEFAKKFRKAKDLVTKYGTPKAERAITIEEDPRDPHQVTKVKMIFDVPDGAPDKYAYLEYWFIKSLGNDKFVDMIPEVDIDPVTGEIYVDPNKKLELK